MLLWDGSDETERWKLAVVDTKKSSPKNSVSMHRNRVQNDGNWQWLIQRNRVQMTRFLPTFFREPTQLLAN